MKPTSALLCIAAAFSVSAAGASTPDVSGPAAFLEIPAVTDTPAPIAVNPAGTETFRLAAMNSYIWTKGQKSGGIKRKGPGKG